MRTARANAAASLPRPCPRFATRDEWDAWHASLTWEEQPRRADLDPPEHEYSEADIAKAEAREERRQAQRWDRDPFALRRGAPGRALAARRPGRGLRPLEHVAHGPGGRLHARRLRGPAAAGRASRADRGAPAGPRAARPGGAPHVAPRVDRAGGGLPTDRTQERVARAPRAPLARRTQRHRSRDDLASPPRGSPRAPGPPRACEGRAC